MNHKPMHHEFLEQGKVFKILSLASLGQDPSAKMQKLPSILFFFFVTVGVRTSSENISRVNSYYPRRDLN